MSRWLSAPQVSGDKNVLAKGWPGMVIEMLQARCLHSTCNWTRPQSSWDYYCCCRGDSEHLASQFCGCQQAVWSPLCDALGRELCWQVSVSVSASFTSTPASATLHFLHVHLCDHVCTYMYTYVHICVYTICMCTYILHLHSLHHLELHPHHLTYICIIYTSTCH